MKLFQQLRNSFSLQKKLPCKYNYYFIIRFLINAALLNVYLLFFRKEINFFKCLYFTKYDIRMSLYVFFWLRKGPSSQYVRNWWGDGDLAKCLQLRKWGGGVMPH